MAADNRKGRRGKRNAPRGDNRADNKRPNNNNQRGAEASHGPVPKKKYAIIFGYSGIGYHGMQRQTPGSPTADLPTIEGALEKALKSVGAFTEAQLEDYSRIQWSRVGRTDKGVHAICQVVTLKLTLGPMDEEDREIKHRVHQHDLAVKGEQGPEALDGTLTVEDIARADNMQRIRELDFLKRLRAAMPEGMIVYDITRVPGNFDARYNCQERQYEYCFPAYVLRPATCHDNTELLCDYFHTYGDGKLEINDENPESQLPRLKLVSYADKAKLLAVLQSRENVTTAWELKSGELGDICERYRAELCWQRRIFSSLSLERRLECWQRYHHAEPEGFDGEMCPYAPPELLSIRQEAIGAEAKAAYSMSESDFTALSALLERFVGHHHWFNYTSRISSTDATGGRRLQSVTLHRMFKRDELEGEIVVVRLRGASFLLNQIRKMVSVAIESMVGTAPYGANVYLLQPPLEPKKHIHLAPGEGLLLERAFFETRNRATRKEIPNMSFSHEFECAHPHGAEMQEMLTSGRYVTSPPKQSSNPLVASSSDSPAAEELVQHFDWLEKEEDEQPVWYRILRFKFMTLLPMTLRIFREQPIFQSYINDVQWHPFFSENFPEPMSKNYFKEIDALLNASAPGDESGRSAPAAASETEDEECEAD